MNDVKSKTSFYQKRVSEEGIYLSEIIKTVSLCLGAHTEGRRNVLWMFYSKISE